MLRKHLVLSENYFDFYSILECLQTDGFDPRSILFRL